MAMVAEFGWRQLSGSFRCCHPTLCIPWPASGNRLSFTQTKSLTDQACKGSVYVLISKHHAVHCMHIISKNYAQHADQQTGPRS